MDMAAMPCPKCGTSLLVRAQMAITTTEGGDSCLVVWVVCPKGPACTQPDQMGLLPVTELTEVPF